MMKRHFKIFILSLVCIFIPSFSSIVAQEHAGPKTLKDIFQEALTNSERITISEEKVREAEFLYRQTLGDSFPEIFYRRQKSLEHKSDTTHDGMFRIVKTDLTGYRELAALRSDRATINQRQYEMQRVEQLLLQDVSLAFYSLLLAKENVAATEKLVAFAQERFTELKERVRVGRARQADAVSQELLITSLQSQLEESLRQVHARKDLLAFLIGAPQLEYEITDVPISIEYGLLENYLGRVNTRPDIQAAQENVKAFKGLRHVARADFFPSLSLSANSYTDHSDAQDEKDWDMSLSVEVPLWDWGSRRAAVATATAVLNQAQQNFQLSLRQAELEIRNAYRDYESAKRQLDIQVQSLSLARQHYQMQVEDDKKGLVTSLEVLESLDRLNNAELAYNNARLQEKLAAINLRITSGEQASEVLK